MAYNPKRTRRKKKGDRLISPDATKNQVACDHAVAPFDRLALEMEKKWGIDRLPELVSPATAEKYGVTMANLNAAISRNVPSDVVACVESAIRGLRYLDEEATRNGAQRASGAAYEYELAPEDGEEPFRFAVIEDSREWQSLKAQRPDLQIFTMQEVAIALKAKLNSPLVEAVKEVFPRAEVTAIREKPNYRKGGDAIPF